MVEPKHSPAPAPKQAFKIPRLDKRPFERWLKPTMPRNGKSLSVQIRNEYGLKSPNQPLTQDLVTTTEVEEFVDRQERVEVTDYVEKVPSRWAPSSPCYVAHSIDTVGDNPLIDEEAATPTLVSTPKDTPETPSTMENTRLVKSDNTEVIEQSEKLE
jgi:hypothetical protein